MKRVFLFGFATVIALILGVVLYQPAFAAEPQGNFSLQVTPSPLISTVKPGETKDLELKVRNASTGPEKLLIEPRSFTFDSKSGEVKLDDATPPEVADWITFSEPKFTLNVGEERTIHVRIAVPKDAGFSYSFTLMIKRDEQTTQNTAGRQLKGSVAVFALLNVDRPGATRKLEITDASSTQFIYDALPAKIKLRFKNTGNTILQPYGNIYIQREANDQTPISTIPVNQKRGYLLPGTERELIADWSDGFAVYKTKTDASGKQVTYLERNLDKLGDIRFGKYTAKVIAVYNNGQRDVPIERVVTFWVIPWKAISLGVLALIGIVFITRYFIKRKTDKAVRKALEKRNRQE